MGNSITEVQNYVLLRMHQGWKMISDGRPWFAFLRSPDGKVRRSVHRRTMMFLAHEGFIEPGDIWFGESQWKLTQSGEKALDAKKKRTAGIRSR